MLAPAMKCPRLQMTIARLNIQTNMMTTPTLSEHTEPTPIFSFAVGEMGEIGS